MGTSAAAGSISAKRRLIPRWIEDVDQAPVSDQQGEPALNGQGLPVRPVVIDTPGEVARRQRAFQNAKTAVTRAVSAFAAASVPAYAVARGQRARGGGGPAGSAAARAERNLRRGLADYVGGRGGAAAVGSRLQKSTEVGARLYDALDRIARDGIDAALRDLAVRPSDDSTAALLDALTSLVLEQSIPQLEGVLDESMARAACMESLMMIYASGRTIADLDAAGVVDLVREFAVQSAYLLVERDIGTTIQDGSAQERDAGTLLGMLRDIIRGAVELELPAGVERRYTVREVREAIRAAYEHGFKMFEVATE